MFKKTVAAACVSAVALGVFAVPAEAAKKPRPAKPKPAASPVNVVEQNLVALQAGTGYAGKGLSVGPEVGWNAGLQGVKPLAADFYRIWDMNVAWKDVNPAPGIFNWDELDRRVSLIESWGGKPVYVLALTPQWAAADPSAGDPRWGAGTSSAPADMASWRAYVDAVASRYGNRIAYEVWNEVNLPTFWTGTVEQMAEMMRVADEAVAGRGTVIAPSVTTRLTTGAKYTPALIAALDAGTPGAGAQHFDVWNVHSYPAGDAGPTPQDACNARADGVLKWERAVAAAVPAGSPYLAKPIWDTEVNYGLAGPGARAGLDWSDSDGAALVTCTYAGNAALGIDSAFWYEFTAAPFDLLGVQMTPQTPGTTGAFNAIR